MMTDTKLLRDWLDEKGIKLKSIAARMGITPYSLQKKINNETEFKASEISVFTLSFFSWNILLCILCLNFSFILSIFLSFYVKFYKNSWDFARGLVAKTPCSQCRSPGFDS